MQYIWTLLRFIIKNMTSQCLTIQHTNWLREDTTSVKWVWCSPLLKCHILNRRPGRGGAGSIRLQTKFPFDFLPQHYIHINYQECTEMSIKSWNNLPPHWGISCEKKLLFFHLSCGRICCLELWSWEDPRTSQLQTWWSKKKKRTWQDHPESELINSGPAFLMISLCGR